MNCKVMGIVNVTPDSFSDGGKYFTPEEALRRAKNMVEEGAEIIDFGGESTRPGSEPIGWEDEWRRIARVVEAASGFCGGDATVSVDTYHPETALRAIEAGATMINCVYDSAVPSMFEIIASRPDVELVVPFRPGESAESKWGLADEEFKKFLPRLYLDPMIGFGTTRQEDLLLLRTLPDLVSVGRVLVGASRKRIVKKLTGEKTTGKNLGGNLGIAAWCVFNSVAAIRVHDVKETMQLIGVLETVGNQMNRN